MQEVGKRALIHPESALAVGNAEFFSTKRKRQKENKKGLYHPV